MALDNDQKATVAEIIEKPLSFVDSVTLTAEQILRLIDDLDLWDLNKNSVKVELKGETNYRAQWLLDAIRERVRVLYGLSRYSDDLSGSSGSYAIPTVPVF